MNLKKIIEEFEDYVKPSYDKKKLYAIYKNPTVKEITQEIGNNEVRVIIDKDLMDIYIFDSELLHVEAQKKLGLKDDSKLIKTTSIILKNGKMFSNSLIKHEVKKNKKLIPLIDKYFDKI